MEFKEFSAKTVSDCITDACTEFCVPSDKLEYKVKFEGSNGFMGIGSKPAIIEARIKSEEPENMNISSITKEDNAVIKNIDNKNNKVVKEIKDNIDNKEYKDNTTSKEPKAANNNNSNSNKQNVKSSNKNNDKNDKNVKEEVVVEKSAKKNLTEDDINNMKIEAKNFLDGVFAAMKIKVNIKCEYDSPDNTMNIDLSGAEMGMLIGKRGQTLDSLQYLVSLVINKGTNDYVRVKVDTENYRKRRKETLENLAKNIAFKVKRTRRPVSLEPMNPYERRIIHSALQNDRYVTTHSEGEEPFRKVVVTLKK